MENRDKTKAQLISELEVLQERIAQLEALETEHSKTVEELRQSENNYRTLFDTAIDGVSIIDGQTMRVVLGNQNAAIIYGFDSPEEMVGLDPFSVIHPDDKQRIAQVMLEDGFKKDYAKLLNSG